MVPPDVREPEFLVRFYTPSLSCVSFRAPRWPAGCASGTGFCIDRKRVFRGDYLRKALIVRIDMDGKGCYLDNIFKE
jgi:hypothetical protein